MARGLQRTIETGQRAPSVSFLSLDGETVTLAGLLQNGPALIAFYKASCPTCQLTLPFLDRLRGGAFQVVSVSQDNAATAREFNAEFEMEQMPALLDTAAEQYAASDAFGITHVPSMFLVQPDGRVSWSDVGFDKRNLEELAGIAGKPVFRPGERVPESKSG